MTTSKVGPTARSSGAGGTRLGPRMAQVLESHRLSGGTEPGDIITLKVDAAVFHDGTGPLIDRYLKEWGVPATGPLGIDRVFVIPDHRVPARDVSSAEALRVVQELARRYGFEYFGPGRGGVSHVVLQQENLVGPGMVLVGADSHTCTAGAVGAFALGLGSSDVAAAMVTGDTWLRMPRVLACDLVGRPSTFVHAYDLMLSLAARYGTHWALRSLVSFRGPALAELPQKERVVLCNLAVEVGAVTAVIEEDAAPGESEVVVDLGELRPYVALPGSPSNGVPVDEVPATKVDQVFIGTCTNGWVEDLREAANILRGRQVHPDVRLIVTPGSARTYLEALTEGLIQDLVAAGASVGPATCGPCSGNHMGVLGNGDVCLSTSSRNFPGRMGSPGAQVYLANPAVAAATALTGVITDPREL